MSPAQRSAAFRAVQKRRGGDRRQHFCDCIGNAGHSYGGTSGRAARADAADATAKGDHNPEAV
jgi:hypothetical protein